MTDGRKTNRPPPAKPSFDESGLAAIKSMLALGVPQTKIAAHLGVDVRTVASAVHKRGAYKDNAESNGAQHPTRTPGYRAGTNTGERL